MNWHSPRVAAAHRKVRQVLELRQHTRPLERLAELDVNDLAERIVSALIPELLADHYPPGVESHGARRTGGV